MVPSCRWRQATLLNCGDDRAGFEVLRKSDPARVKWASAVCAQATLPLAWIAKVCAEITVLLPGRAKCDGIFGSVVFCGAIQTDLGHTKAEDERVRLVALNWSRLALAAKQSSFYLIV